MTPRGPFQPLPFCDSVTSAPTGSNWELPTDLVAAQLLCLPLVADEGNSGETRPGWRAAAWSFPRRRGAEHAAIALAQAPLRSLSDALCVQTICYILPFSLLFSSVHFCHVPSALKLFFSLPASLGQQTVIRRSSSKEAQSSESPSPGVMLEADPPAKSGEALPLKGALKVSSETQNHLPGYDTVTPLTHVAKHMRICSVGEAPSFMMGLHAVFLLLHF